jgi:hypothetical protein
MDMSDRLGDYWIDANGVPAERVRMGGQEIIVHYDDIPEQDRTVVDGIPCTTALRTVIDIAPDLDDGDLRRIVADCLRRGLFTVDDGMTRTAEDDMRPRLGARMLRRSLAEWL